MTRQSKSLAIIIGLVVLLVLAATCSKKLEPGYYLVGEAGESSTSGVIRVLSDQTAVFYRDENRLFADSVSVQIKGNSRKATIRYQDGSSVSVSVKPYVAPEFHHMSGVSLYRDPRYKVHVEQDVSYGNAMGFWTSYPDLNESYLRIYVRKVPELASRHDVELTMDIYTPEDDPSESRPLLLLIHGGGFLNGDKAEESLVDWANHFASLGYVVSSINYRLGFRPVPESVDCAAYRALQDANAAIRYLLQQDSLSIDPRLIFVAGESAGAITALNLAYMEEYNRPSSTRSSLFGLFEDEGPIDDIVPPEKQSFSIRAIGNLWGAVSDTVMLRNSRVPVISFQSQTDRTVPYGTGHPFENLFDSSWYDVVEFAGGVVLSGLFGWPLEIPKINTFLFREMSGASVVDRVLRSNGIHSELHAYPDRRHRLHLNEGQIIPSIFQEIQDGLEAFFSSEMEPCPASLRQDPKDPQRFFINASEVDLCYWKVEGGMITGQSSDEIRVLMLPDKPVHTVTVSGTYHSGMAFCDSYDLD